MHVPVLADGGSSPHGVICVAHVFTAHVRADPGLVWTALTGSPAATPVVRDRVRAPERLTCPCSHRAAPASRAPPPATAPGYLESQIPPAPRVSRPAELRGSSGRGSMEHGCISFGGRRVWSRC